MPGINHSCLSSCFDIGVLRRFLRNLIHPPMLHSSKSRASFDGSLPCFWTHFLRAKTRSEKVAPLVMAGQRLPKVLIDKISGGTTREATSGFKISCSFLCSCSDIGVWRLYRSQRIHPPMLRSSRSHACSDGSLPCCWTHFLRAKTRSEKVAPLVMAGQRLPKFFF